MSDQINEIYQAIDEAVTEDVALGATSASKVAEFRLIEYLVTAISNILQGIWDIKKRDLQAVADAVATCNEPWFAREISRFQYGDTLILNSQSKKYGYAEENLDAQIVTQVAVSDQGGVGIIKVAKDGPSPLSNDERLALSSYVKKIQPLGSNIVLISQAADVIKLVGTIHVDPIIPVGTIQANVEQAINDYLASLAFQSDRKGTLYTTYLIDAIQAVEGVLDVTLSEVAVGQSGDVTLATVNRKYVPVAGYFVVHPDHALADNLTYSSDI